MTLIQEIKLLIERCLDLGKKIALFPMGDIGIQTKLIMKEIYGIEPEYMFDNKICKYNQKVLSLDELDKVDLNNVQFIYTIAKDNPVSRKLQNVLKEKKVNYYEFKYPYYERYFSGEEKIGRHTYGEIIDGYSMQFVESIGAFCSFAEGTRVVQNHSNQYISTSPFIYHDRKVNEYLHETYEDCSNYAWYVEGIEPKGIIRKANKCKIGNDVWLGRNVTITNGANIGNGVIAGAGAVITKDVPDYAVVGGVPAKIIRYRYNSDQIEALNRICWWDWTDEQIKERYDDFFLPIEDFIEKYDR